MGILDCISFMQNGSEFTKVRPSSKRYRRTFVLDVDHSMLRWCPTNKKPDKAAIRLDSIKDIRAGSFLTGRRQSESLSESTDKNLIFSIIWGDNYQCLNLIADSPQTAFIWVAGLKSLVENKKEAIDLILRLNPRIPKKQASQKIKEVCFCSAPKTPVLNASQFCNAYKELSTRLEIYFLVSKFSKQDCLRIEDLKVFLESEQGMSSVTTEFCTHLINDFEPCDLAREAKCMTVDGFTAYLLSHYCNVLHPKHLKVCQDMEHPLNDYFILTSFNTHLLEDQLKGPSGVEGYIRALNVGCRFLQLEVWYDEDEKLLVRHGLNTESKVQLLEVLKIINEFAFLKSEYPLIIQIESHLQVVEQKILASQLLQIFGDKLFCDGDGTDFLTLPSPQSLRGKILIKGKKLAGTEDGEVSDEDESTDWTKSKRALRKMVDFALFLYHKKPYEVCSLYESSALRLIGTYSDEFLAYTRRFLTRVYPNVVRIDSSNFNPLDFWSHGCQMVALNFQTSGLMTDLMRGKFLVNGNCGYVLKPPLLREEGNYYSFRDTVLQYKAQTVYLKVISAQQLPRPIGSSAKGDSLDPYVIVEIFGLPNDCAEERTKTIENESLNAIFDETFQFQVTVPELALVRFLVLDDYYIDDDFIGQYTLPLECMQTGYRHLTLLNAYGEPMENTTLFIHTSISANRKSSKTGSYRLGRGISQSGLKLLGIKRMDSIFKNAVPLIAETRELRESLEKAFEQWQEFSGFEPGVTLRQGLWNMHARIRSIASEAHDSPQFRFIMENEVYIEHKFRFFTYSY
ncbi:unnamed protein product [Soboliphyme baturini]|uniref:Phosphoinositide phospholipase C n=1 Tax=Soboliphyme baturini TaxID=241478 RepID=A0A183IN16_9BILA|nr:unnamed protein product [Soboliphyme baturini]